MSTYNMNVTMFKVKLVSMTKEVQKLAATVYKISFFVQCFQYVNY